MAAIPLQTTSLPAGTVVNLFSPDTKAGVIKLQVATLGARQEPLTNARDATGIPVTATAAAGVMGISRTAGTSLQLVGEVTASNAKTDACTFYTTLPDSYNTGAPFTITVNAGVAGSGTLTAVSTTLTVAVNGVAGGVETALVVTGGTQQIVAAATDYTWSVAATGLAPRSTLAITLTMVITTASGANTGQINNLSLAA